MLYQDKYYNAFSTSYFLQRLVINLNPWALCHKFCTSPRWDEPFSSNALLNSDSFDQENAKTQTKIANRSQMIKLLHQFMLVIDLPVTVPTTEKV